jgi:hypothetical protein
MFSSPLAWFEVSGLPESYVAQAARLIAAWKKHRAKIFSGTIVPVGALPDGASWTGLVSRSEECAHVLVFREHSTVEQGSIELPVVPREWKTITRLGGDGSALWNGQALQVQSMGQLRFGWFAITP